MPTFRVDDGNAPIDIIAKSAEAAAKEYVDTGDWGENDGTICIDVWVTPYSSGGVGGHHLEQQSSAKHRVEIEPPEPNCTSDEHAWMSPVKVLGGLRENPGVWGHGGGVIIREVCARCGKYRKTDTWATNSSDGTNYTCVSYEDPDDASRGWIEEEAQ